MPTNTQFSTNWETLGNLEIINGASLADLEISDAVLDGTIWARLYAQESSNGTKHEYEKEVDTPVVGFRDVNTGKKGTAGVDELVTVGLKGLEVTVEADKLLAQGYRRRQGGIEAYFARKSKRKLRAAFHHTGTQTIYGTGSDTDGFVGLAENALLNTITSEKVIDAGGTGSDLESVYIIRTAEDGLSALYSGEDGLLSGFGDIQDQQLYRIVGGELESFAGLVATLCSWLGLQVGSKHDVVRVCNIDFNDHASIEDAIQDGLSLFPGGFTPNDIWASRRIKRAIQKGRQKTSTEARRVGMATDVDGVPLSTVEALIPETQLTT